MQQDPLFERLWIGTAQMEEWTQAVSDGAVTSVNSPIHTVIYTHGHIDHPSGIAVIDAEADTRGILRPRIIAHRNVQRRLSRYQATHGFNSIVQGRQFNYPGYVYPSGALTARTPGAGVSTPSSARRTR